MENAMPSRYAFVIACLATLALASSCAIEKQPQPAPVKVNWDSMRWDEVSQPQPVFQLSTDSH